MVIITPNAPFNAKGIPKSIKTCPHWVIWRNEPNPDPTKKPLKVPYQPKHPRCRASSTNPDHWVSYKQAEAAYNKGNFSGLGVVLDDGGIVALDFDNVIADATPVDDPKIRAILTLLLKTGAYIEISPSGLGVRALVKGNLPKTLTHKDKGTNISLEIYTNKRYVTITGAQRGRGELVECQHAIDAMVQLINERKGIMSTVSASSGTDNSDLTSGLPDEVGWEQTEKEWHALSDEQKEIELDKMLAALPTDVWEGSYENWLKFMMACARSGAPSARELFRKYSKYGNGSHAKLTAYPGDDGFDAKWGDVERRGGKISITYLIAAAIKAGLHSKMDEPYILANNQRAQESAQVKSNPAHDPRIEALAKLSPMEYDQVRTGEAEALKVRTKTLDKEVAKVRGIITESYANDVVEEIPPWSEPVDGSALLDGISRTISSHVILPKHADTALALWALGTFCMDVWRLWPKLLITSPEKRCGKSTLLEAVEGVVYRALLTSNISPSAVFRCVDEWAPTLLIDEADTFAKDSDELNGIINAGHTKRTATVIRTEKVGDDFTPRKFSVWCPQVISGIGDQRGTLHDRSIHIELKRKYAAERSTKLPADYYEKMQHMRQKCLRWATDNSAQLQTSTVRAPAGNNDRMQDNWSPLFAIAELVGCDWLGRVKSAHQSFDVEDLTESPGIMLLADIRKILSKLSAKRITSADLVLELIKLEDRPWLEWKRGNPMTQNSLARLLKQYRITSKNIRIREKILKGYELSDFEEIFARYLPSP